MRLIVDLCFSHALRVGLIRIQHAAPRTTSRGGAARERAGRAGIKGGGESEHKDLAFLDTHRNA